MARRSRSLNSLAARALAASADADDPIQAIELLVADLLEETEQAGPPVDLRLAASFRHVVKVEPTPMTDAGALVRTNSGLKIFVRATDNLRRQNFTIGHEICHTFFPGTISRVPLYDKSVGEFAGSDEEFLCDIGASRLILPPDWLRPRLIAEPASLERFMLISEEFDASFEATAIACAAMDVWGCAILFFEEMLKPAEERMKNQLILPGLEADMAPEPTFRISLACHSRQFKPFLPRYKSVPRNGVIQKALEADGPVSGHETLDLGKASCTLSVQAIRVPYRQDQAIRERVMAIAWPQAL
jgi:hypothetical protein